MKIFTDAIEIIENVLEYKEIPDHFDGVSTGVLRHLRRIDYAIKKVRKHKFKIPDWQMNILRVGVYLSCIDHDFQTEIAVNTAVELAKKRGDKHAGFVNAALRKISANYKILSTPSSDNYPAYLAVLHSHPDFLVNRWLKRYGKKYTELLLSKNNKTAPKYFRVNQIFIDIENIYNHLIEHEIPFEAHPKMDNFFKLTSDDIKTSEWDMLRNGFVVVQDPAFEAPSLCLSPKSGDRILEIGCAPGGKTSRIAEMLKDEGEIVAIDSNEERLYLAESNLKRLKLNHNVKFMHADGRDFRDKDKFDKVLVDPPCSSLGVIRRHPEIKWLRSEKDILRLSEFQKSLAFNAMENVKTGGLLVWSTCTTEPEENEEIVKYILSFGNFEIQNIFFEELREIREKPFYVPSPAKGDYDGGFCAIMKKVR